MAKIDYPVALTQKDWDKKKPLAAKTKATGIGDLLKALNKDHAAIKWSEFEMKNQMSLASLEGAFEIALKQYKSNLEPLAKDADKVEDLASSWAAKYAKDKLIPKTAQAACKAIADAAKDYAKEVRDFDQLIVTEYKEERKKLEATLRSVLKPMLGKNVLKIDLLLKDIATFKSSPTKENLLALATGDGGARGYCTACKNWDQFLKDFPDLRDDVWKGKAMDTFFPALKDYGANHPANKWGDMIQEQMDKYKLTEEDVLKRHAVFLDKQVAEIKKFKGYLEAILDKIA